jgi:RHS repeat-associated protein
MPEQSLHQPMSHRAETVSRTTYSGITELSVRMGDGFAVVQTHHWESTSRPHDQGGGISEREFNPFFAHRWNERCEVVEIKELPVATDLHRSTDYRPRLVVAGSMVLIDAVPPKAMGLISGVNRRWAFRFLGDRWGGNDYSHDSLQNNFVGIDSFTITNDGKAQFYEWNHLRSEWVARIGSFADGNPTLWEKVWGYLYLIEMVLTLPLDWEIALPLDLAFMLTDQLMSQLANPEVAAARANRFFAAGNQLHYRQPNGKWNDLGSLVAEYRGRRVGEWDESLRLQRHSTQAAGSFITYVAELNQTQEVTYPGPPPDHIPQKRTETRSGYPKTTPWVRLLKNGGTFGQPFKLPDGEWLTRHSDDQSELIGADIFVTYCAGKLGDATRLHLYRVINDACTGPLTTYVAASEAVNDGMSVSYTHYRFENGLAQPSGSDALFNKTTVIPSGPSASPDLRNGCTEHFFYTGGGNPLEVKDSDSMLYPVLAGSPYYTRTFRSENGNLAEARSERLRWWVRKLPLVRNETMFLPRVAVQTTLADGMLTTVMSSFPDETKGLPLEVYTSHKNLAGEEEHRLVSYRYAWALHPDLERQNLLTALAETRTTVNQRLVEATGYQWSRLGPELSGDPDRWFNLRYPVWGARSAFVARNADAPMLQRSGEPPPEHWLRTLRAVGQMPRGIVTETVDADGRVTSTVYDTEYRYALASFAGASVSEAQAGYLGFSQIERKEGWQLTGTHEPLGGGRTGTGRLAGSTASVRPGRFSPRPGIGYVVGAWIQTREGGAGAAIGFGANARTIPAAPTWRYVEHTVTSPTPDAAPFVRCDGNIDCIHFRPVDAGFSATVYDPDTGLPLSHQDQLGNIRRTAYNDAHEAIIETGPGEQPLRMYTRTYASQLARALHAALLPENDRADLRPNIRLMVSSQDGGRYTGPGPWLIRGGEGVPLLSGPFETPGRPRSLATPTGTALRFTVRHGADARLQILNGSATLEFEQGLIRLIDRSGRNWQVKGDPGSYEFLVAVIGNQLLLFAGARLLLRQEITEPGAFTLRSAPNSTAPCEVRHVATMVSPVLTLAYADGLGREIQLQTMHPNGTGLIAAQTIYDGWGQAAVHTKPAPIGWSAQYQPGLVTAYDWTSGRLHGEVSLYFRSIPEVAGSPDDAYFACTRQVSERSPLARALEQCNPGKRFAPGGGLTVRMDYSRTADAKWLYQQVGLPQTDAYRSVTRYLPLGPGQINPHVEIFDRAGNRIASAIGIGPERTATSYRSRRDPSGEWMITSLPNRQNPAFPDLGESGTTATHVDFLGHPDERRDPDSGTLLRIGDPVGRLRFYMDAAGAAQSPQRFQYLVYDAAGRPVEHGELTQAWSPQQLRQAAADRAWPSREPGATWMTRWLYDCDGTAETAKANGRLRELQSCGPDRQVVTKRYFYDTHGRAVRVDQLVPGFDATTRSVLYDYDAQDRVIAIHYPGERQRSVYHTFNAAGRLWRVGEDGQPARFAEYAYTVDGAVARELLNERRIQGRYRYDFHGRLLDIDYTGPGDQRYFQTTLEYGSENLGAAVTSVTSGASLATPKPHRYRYAYNSLSRLIMASTDPAAGLQLEPRWEFTGPYGGPVGIDPNGNLQARRDGGMVYAPSYAPGSNRLDALSLMGQPAQRVQHDASGRLRSLLNLRSLSYSGARVVPDSVEIPTGTVQLRYNGAGQRVLKLAGSRKRLYVHGQGGLPVAEFTGNSAEEVQYVQGATGLTAYLRDGKPYFVIRDQLGSTRLVLDGDGKHVAHYNYLPFGGLQPDNSTNPKESPLQYLYTGQEFDMELGCYNYRARLYDPALGRFHCPDPAGEWSSPYTYVGNNPISRTDPSGLLSRVQLRLALGLAYTSVYAAVGAGIGYASGGDSEERKRRAGIGAIVGASFGAFRGITEAGIGLWRSGWGANAGAPQPIIVYYEGQQLYGLATGRMGAELIAEAQRIPRSRWGTHLISRERIDGGRAAWPQVAEFNGQLIAVGHGTEGAAAAELGIYRQGEVYQAADGRLHTRSAWAGSEGLRSFVPARFTVTNVDLSVCYAARSGFAVDVGATFTARRGANVPVRSGANTVSPLGAWHTSGHVRDVGLGVNTLEMIFGIPLSWTRIF